MLAQYRRLKGEHPDALLFFRMGDFYELFFEDAVTAAAILDIALTKRGRQDGADVPMCGVPAHNAEPYLHRLIRAGCRVAVCEQLEATRERGRGLLRREVVRIVTPGTLTEEGLLDARRHNFLLALGLAEERLGAAWVDISTGMFRTETVERPQLADLLARLEPGEIIAPDALAGLVPEDWRPRLGPPPAGLDSLRATRRLTEFFKVATLDAFGTLGRAEIAAAGSLLDYLELTQKGALPRLQPPRPTPRDGVLRLDAATRRSLELTRTQTGERAGSLLETIDRTVSSAGARLLAERLAAPSTSRAEIVGRLDEIGAFVNEAALRDGLRALLRHCPDLERALGRITLGRGGPRDLVAVARGLTAAAEVRTLLGASDGPVAAMAAELPDLGALAGEIGTSLVDEPPPSARDGQFVRAGVDAELDELRGLGDHGRRHLAALEASYRALSGIASLKIRHNNILGYHVEVTNAHRAKVPAGFIQRQGMATATRYGTAELAELERRIATAAERALARELVIFERLCAAVTAAAASIDATARLLARLDVASALATLAAERRWSRPEILEEGGITIAAGRHPIVEAALAARHEPFVANGLELDQSGDLWLMTGPNMAGKSTFLRQNALIVVLAQMGAFVPAERAQLGIVDRLFSRVGAADDLARGRSTFLVEMVETAAILNQATPRSFVILDEIGRGTATHDGLSIACAVVEHLHDVNRCRGLFATHYHELTALAGRLPRLTVHTMAVREWRGEIVFLHEVMPGAADRSYGIHVAKLAGLPAPVIARASEILRALEAAEPASGLVRLVEDLPLFAAALERRPRPAPTPGEAAPLLALLAEVRPDELTPRAALELVYRLKAMAAAAET